MIRNTEEDIWAEDLPDGCPPPDAAQPNNENYFRLVDNLPPTDLDFRSTRQEFPNRQLNDECLARSISLTRSQDSCEQLKRFPYLKRKMIIQFSLPPTSGVVKKTGRNVKDHWSWWRLKNYDIVSIIKNVI